MTDYDPDWMPKCVGSLFEEYHICCIDCKLREMCYRLYVRTGNKRKHDKELIGDE